MTNGAAPEVAPGVPRVTVSLPSLLRSAAGGRGEVEAAGSTLKEVLEDLFRRHPMLRRHVFDDAGEQREHVNVFLNDQNVRWLESFDEPVRDGDTVTVLQAVSGG